MARGIQAALANDCVYVSAAGTPIDSSFREDEYIRDQSLDPVDDFSTAEDSRQSMTDLSPATCLTVANPDLETVCGNSASPRQAAALAALIMEAAGGAHNAFPEALRAAVVGEKLQIEPQAKPLAVTAGPAVRKIRISSNPSEGWESYGIGDTIEVEITFSETVNVTGTPQLGLKVGNIIRRASYSRGTGTTVLVFSYTVAEDDEDTDGLGVEAGSLSVDNGVIEDGSENAAALNHAGLPRQAGQRVDGVKPSLMDSDAGGGERIQADTKLRRAARRIFDAVGRRFPRDVWRAKERGVTTVAVTGNAVTLALASSVVQGEAVTASYTKPPGKGRRSRSGTRRATSPWPSPIRQSRTGPGRRRSRQAGQLSARSRAADPVAAVGQGPPDARPAEGEFAASGGTADAPPADGELTASGRAADAPPAEVESSTAGCLAGTVTEANGGRDLPSPNHGSGRQE